MTRGPTIVVCLFDQKSNGPSPSDNAKLQEMKRVHTPLRISFVTALA